MYVKFGNIARINKGIVKHIHNRITRSSKHSMTLLKTTTRNDAPVLMSEITSNDISERTRTVITKYRSVLDAIENGSVSTDPFLTLSHALGEASESSAELTLPSMTHGSASVRSASTSAKDELKQMFDETFSRPKLYRVLADSASANPDSLSRYFLNEFRRKGCPLSSEDRETLVRKRIRIEELCSEFQSSLNEDETTVLFEEGELEGVDVSRYPLEGTKRVVSLKAPDTLPLLKFATRGKTRRAVARAGAEKCQTANTSRFLETVRLRHECASLLGYESHAAYMLEVKMASKPERAEEFLRNVWRSAKQRLVTEMETLRSLKREEEGGEGHLEPWDMSYYIRKHKETLGIDEARLRTYFPLEHVKNEILRIYEELLGLTFTKMENAEVWHPQVEGYAVTPRDSSSEEPIGFFYLDLFPRTGKYSHQCVYPLRPRYTRRDGTISLPACANIGNLSQNTDGTPSLLWFKEVETFFHEFGHVMHCVLSESKHSVKSWAWSAVPWPGGVEQDFLEVPSMMLENFVWEPEVLRRLSRRLEDGASLPEEDILRLADSRNVMGAYSRCRYLGMALYDLTVHSGPGPYSHQGQSLDAVELYHALMEDISGMPSIPNTFPVASWYHPMMGYDAGYYGYYWSEAYAADLFAAFQDKTDSASILNPTLGLKYRDSILSPCATLDGNTMLRNFLGREPSLDPFLDRLFPK